MPHARKWISRFPAVALLVLCALLIRRQLAAPSAAARTAAQRLFICAHTGQTFQLTLRPGMAIPALSPYTGRATGYPAELCYWTADGRVQARPTPVLLNTCRNSRRPTFCPECGRLVVGHNPYPVAGARPPPTRQEYLALYAMD